MKTKVIDYDKSKAKRNFVLFKLAEVFGVFLFLFGFNPLGKFSYSILGDFFIISPESYMDFWMSGFLTLFCLYVGVVALCAIGYIVNVLIKLWIKSNWEWAKKSVENPKSKIERLKEKEKLKSYKKRIPKMNDRKKYGYCKGDLVLIKREAEDLIKNKRYKINEVGSDGKAWVTDEEGDSHCVIRGDDNYYRYELIKQKIPSLPKLNSKYIEKETEVK